MRPTTPKNQNIELQNACRIIIDNLIDHKIPAEIAAAAMAMLSYRLAKSIPIQKKEYQMDFKVLDIKDAPKKNRDAYDIIVNCLSLNNINPSHALSAMMSISLKICHDAGGLDVLEEAVLSAIKEIKKRSNHEANNCQKVDADGK